MNSLHELQRECRKAFSGGDPAPLLPSLVDNNGIPAVTRVRVYQNNARETYRKTLLNSYPVVERLVGDACFRSLSLKYASIHPSISGDLQYFGRSYDEFLDAEYGGSDYDYLADVARLEWAIEEALLAPASSGLDLGALAELSEADYPQLVFTFSSSLRILHSNYPILSIWRANQGDNEERVNMNSAAQSVFVHRVGDEAELQVAETGTFELARVLLPGLSLGEALHELPDDLDFDLSRALQSLMVSGCLDSFSISKR